MSFMVWIPLAAVTSVCALVFWLSWRSTPSSEKSPRTHAVKRLFQAFIAVHWLLYLAFALASNLLPTSWFLGALLGLLLSEAFLLWRYKRAVDNALKLPLSG